MGDVLSIAESAENQIRFVVALRHRQPRMTGLHMGAPHDAVNRVQDGHTIIDGVEPHDDLDIYEEGPKLNDLGAGHVVGRCLQPSLHLDPALPAVLDIATWSEERVMHGKPVRLLGEGTPVGPVPCHERDTTLSVCLDV